MREIPAELVVTDAAVKQHLLHLYDKFEIPAGSHWKQRHGARRARAAGCDLPEKLGAVDDQDHEVARSVDALDAF